MAQNSLHQHSSLYSAHPWSGLWVRDQLIPLCLQGEYSWQHSVTSFSCLHFLFHPIMGNEAKNPQEVKGIVSIHNR